MARNLTARLEQMRSVPQEGRRDPLGVRVTVDLELQGLRGVDLYSASVDAWVPLPEAPGPYRLELLVTDGTAAATLDNLHSEPFD